MDETQQQPQFGQPFPAPAPVQQHQTRHERQQHRNKMLLFGAGGALVAVVLLVGVYFLFLKGDSKQPAQQATNTQQGNKGQAAAEQQVAADPTPQTFKSDKLGIELTHRKDWALKESSDGALTITSPQISYVGSDGKSKTGVFTVRIGKGTNEAQQASIDKSIATRDSEVIAYTAPVASQRQYTTLSYVGSKDMFGFFLVTSNTNFKAGAPLQYAMQFSADSYLIAGGYGADAGNSLAFDPVPKASMDSDTLQEAIKIVESLKIY